MKKYILLAFLISISIFGLGIGYRHTYSEQIEVNDYWWPIQAVDTMKYSRDTSREYLAYPERLKKNSKIQINSISQTGATHVAISTPYDEEFYPVLTTWAKETRQNGMKVWFRGNWSGWEEWFEYPAITREEHIQKTKDFILNHPDLFEDGDIFTACPECENGGPGDPRMTGDKEGFQKFLIDEHNMMVDAFKEIDKKVQFNLNSMNGDVAKLVMDKPTTLALGGVVTVDHYVSTPEKMKNDLIELANSSGGNIVLGEFGAPIPDINGSLTPEEQADLIGEFMDSMSQVPQIIGMNYWTGFGGSTAIWDGDGKPFPAVGVLTSYFRPKTVNGFITDYSGKPVSNALLKSEEKFVETNGNGSFSMPYINSNQNIKVSANRYLSGSVKLSDLLEVNNPKILLEPENPSLGYKLIIFFQKLF